MDDQETPLIEVEIPEISDIPDSNSWSKCLPETPSKWICCTFRVRVVGVIVLLLLQVPILGYYYYSSSSLYMTKFSNSYGHIMDGVFGSNRLNSTEAHSLIIKPEILPLSTVTRNNYSYVAMTTLAVANDHVQKTTSAVLPTSAAKTNTSHSTTTSISTSTTQSTTTTTTVPATTKLQTEAATAADGSILPQCPPEPPGLQGRLPISFDKPPSTFEQTALDNPLLTEGGHGKPPLCLARFKVAIIIPYRDRVEHLRYFVQFMHPTLQRQQIDYQIFIVNQFGHGKFNRAKLMNIGFLEALKLYPFDCFSFHDVDLIVEDDRSLYWCSDRPRHMSAGVDKFNYVLPYGSIFGGVTLLSKEQMEKINGFSNEFWGWGGEDDDVFNRLKIAGYQIVRYPMDIARYKMIRHQREQGNEPNPKRFDMIRKTHLTYKKDGLNSIKYKVHSVELQPTYTNVTVDVMGPN